MFCILKNHMRRSRNSSTKNRTSFGNDLIGCVNVFPGFVDPVWEALSDFQTVYGDARQHGYPQGKVLFLLHFSIVYVALGRHF